MKSTGTRCRSVVSFGSNRIEAVDLVENGADFIELYRWNKARGDTGFDAFYNTQRVFVARL